MIRDNEPRNARHAPKAKHFSQTSNNQCHGVSPAHCRLEMYIAESIRLALEIPPEQRNFSDQILYRSFNEKYGVHSSSQSALPSNFEPRGFEPFQLRCHTFDLMDQPADVKTEAKLAAGRTHADITGLNHQGELIGIVEIVRSTPSDGGTDNDSALAGIPPKPVPPVPPRPEPPPGKRDWD